MRDQTAYQSNQANGQANGHGGNNGRARADAPHRPDVVEHRQPALDGAFFETFAQLPTQRQQGSVIRTTELAEYFGAERHLATLHQQAGDLQSQVDAAVSEGHENGLADGRSEAAREFAQHLNRIEQEVATFFSNAEETIADLAVRVAETIIGQVGGADADYLAISRAIGANLDREPFIVHAASDSVQTVRKVLADMKADYPKARLPVAKADNRLPPGRAVLVTRFGSVDLDVQSQLRAIRENLANTDWGAKASAQNGDAHLGNNGGNHGGNHASEIHNGSDG
jgi:flagellar biosynthesis/type III secretory pathway protein FliH